MASIYKRRVDRNSKKKPWMIAYTDETGRRQIVTGSLDKGVTQEIARKLEIDVSRRRRGVVTADEERFEKEGRRPINEHVDEYLTDCQHQGQNATHISNKRTQLSRLNREANVSRLVDIDPNLLTSHLQALKASGSSHRTVNQHRGTVIAFLNWCVLKKRIPRNPVKSGAVKALDEREDSRRVRRALSGEELNWLLESAPKRRTLYLCAYWTGLRRNELRSINRGDVDLDRGTLRVRFGVGKGKHEDEIPLHPELHDALRSHISQDAKRSDLIFPVVSRVTTLYRDLKRARDRWISAATNDVERKRREESDFLCRVDSEGRQVDLHALRSTLGTHLARHGVSPQVHQRLMRHTDYRVTLKHYTHLQLRDDAAAIESLPAVAASDQAEAAQAAAATGTDGPPARSAFAARRPQNAAPSGATVPDGRACPTPAGQADARPQDLYNASVSTERRPTAPPRAGGTASATKCEKTRAIGAVG